MSSDIKYNIKISVDGKEAVVETTRSVKDLANEAEATRKALRTWTNLAMSTQALTSSLQSLTGLMKEYSDANRAQVEVETKLATVMKQRMNASDAEIQSIKDLASAQQALGVVGDEVQLAGIQQVATFLNQKSSIETLVPAMNNLLVQQKGLNATQGDAQQIGNLLGKAMQGQVDALKRVGITFTEAEANVMKFGTETDRAAMLAKIITNNVGEMNAAMARTDAGKAQQMANTIGDLKEKVGALYSQAEPVLVAAAQIGMTVSGLVSAGSAVSALTKAMKLLSVSMKSALTTARALKLAVKALAVGSLIGGAIAALSAILEHFSAKANEASDASEKLASSEEAMKSAYASARTSIDAEIERLKGLMDANENTTAAVNELNRKYSEAFGIHKTAAEWYNVLTTRSEAYCRQLGYQAQAQALASEVAAKAMDVEIQNEKIRELWRTGKAQTKSTVYTQSGPSIAGGIAEAQSVTYDSKELRDARAVRAQAIKDYDALNQRLEIANRKVKELGLNTAEISAPTVSPTKATSKVSKAAPAFNWEQAQASVAIAGEEGLGSAYDKNFYETLNGIREMIKKLTDELGNATEEEAVGINKEIAVWQAKADAITNAGKSVDEYKDKITEASAEVKKLSFTEGLQNGTNAMKGLQSGIQGITDALKGNGNAWQTVIGIVDGFIGLYQGIQTIVGIIQLLTGASAAHAATKGVEATAEGTEATVRATTAATNAATSAAIITANKLEAASWKELAAAEYMAAHAYIPFAGFGIAMGFTTAMLAAVTAAGIPMLADGGLASGPTLAMVGEYAGASGNPEVIAPLDKLRSLIGTPEGVGGNVEFRISGRELVGILKKESNILRRT